MNSYIIKPVQRTFKYQQLLKRLSACCEDVRGEILDAMEVMRGVTQKANDASNLSLLEGYNVRTGLLGCNTKSGAVLATFSVRFQRNRLTHWRISLVRYGQYLPSILWFKI